jgi:hypothetical protein
VYSQFYREIAARLDPATMQSVSHTIEASY